MVRFLVDSSSDFMKEEMDKQGVYFISLGITLDGSSFQDGIDLSKDRFYQLLTGSTGFPKTAMPSPAAFIPCFEAAKENDDEVVCILLSSALSGTYQSAVTAKSMVEYDGIYIIDSLRASACIRIMLDYAVSLRDSGMDGEQIADRLEQFKHRVRVYAALDTLEYLYRGGRLSRAAAAVGKFANIKPIVAIDDSGKVSVVKKAMSGVRARRDLMDILRGLKIDRSFPVYSLYTLGTENCEKLEAEAEEAGIIPAKRVQIGPTIGAHVGPEVFGMFYVAEEE